MAEGVSNFGVLEHKSVTQLAKELSGQVKAFSRKPHSSFGEQVCSNLRPNRGVSRWSEEIEEIKDPGSLKVKIPLSVLEDERLKNTLEKHKIAREVGKLREFEKNSGLAAKLDEANAKLDVLEYKLNNLMKWIVELKK